MKPPPFLAAAFAAFASVAAAIFAAPPLSAQETAAPQAGFVNILNLVALPGPTRIDFGGFGLAGGGPVPPGEGSGILAIVPGAHTFTLENPDAKPSRVSGAVQVENGRTLAVVCYDEVRERGDGSREVRLRYNVLVEADEAAGPRLSLVSLLGEPLVGVEVSRTPVTLVPREAHRMPLAVGDEVRITRRGGLLAEFEVDKPVHYLGFLFENPNSGEVELSLILNEKLEYQPPLDPDEDGEAGEDRD